MTTATAGSAHHYYSMAESNKPTVYMGDAPVAPLMSADKKTSLLEQKRVQWARERAQLDGDFFSAFGKSDRPRTRHNSQQQSVAYANGSTVQQPMVNRSNSNTEMNNTTHDYMHGNHHYIQPPMHHQQQHMVNGTSFTPSAPHLQASPDSGVGSAHNTPQVVYVPYMPPSMIMQQPGQAHIAPQLMMTQAQWSQAQMVASEHMPMHYTLRTPMPFDTASMGQPVPVSLCAHTHTCVQTSYTEQWAAQLPLWSDRPTLPPAAGDRASPQMFVRSVASRRDSTSTPSRPIHASLPMDNASTHSSDMLQATQRMGQSRASSRRRTDPDWEERQIKANELRVAIDEQIAERRRMQQFEHDREQYEIEQAECERRLFEQRAAAESELETNKWKHVADRDARSARVAQAIQRAEIEAAAAKTARLRQHQHQAQADDSSTTQHPPAPTNQTVNGDVMVNGYGHSAAAMVDTWQRPVSSSSEQQHEQRDEHVEQQQEHSEQQQQKHNEQQQEHSGSLSARSKESSSGPISDTNVETTSVVHPPPPVQSEYFDNRPLRPAQRDALDLWAEIEPTLPASEGRPAALILHTPLLLADQPKTPARGMANRRSMRAKQPSATTPVERRARSSERTSVKSQNTTQPTHKTANGVKSEPANTTIISVGNTAKTKPQPLLSTTSSAISVRPPKSSATRPPVTPLTLQRGKHTDTRENVSVKPAPVNDIMPNIPTNIATTPHRKLLSRRPSMETMLKAVEPSRPESVPDASIAENPWGDTLGPDCNPLLQPLSMRRKSAARRTPTNERGMAFTAAVDIQVASSANSSDHSEPVVHLITAPLRVRPTTPSRAPAPSVLKVHVNDTVNEDTVVFNRLLSPARLMSKARSKPDVNDGSDASSSKSTETGTKPSFGFRRGPMHQSLSAKTIKSTNERQSQILEQLSQLRAQLKSKQRQMETTYSSPMGLSRQGSTRLAGNQ